MLFIVLALIFWVLLHHTTIGRSLYAIGGNQTAARFSGVNISRLKMLLFISSGVDQRTGGNRFHLSVFQFASG